MISITDEKEWGNLVNAMGNPAWCDESKFTDMESRYLNQDELDNKIGIWTSQKTPNEVFNILQKAGVPAGAVQTPDERVDNDPQLKYRDFLPEIKHPELGTTRVEAIPMKMSSTPWNLKRSSPLLGEHSAEIYMELLGVDGEELASLYEEGIA